MKEIGIGDIVTRQSYGGDIFFRVDAIEHRQDGTQAILRSLSYRLYADAPLEDLEQKKMVEVAAFRKDLDKKRSQTVKMVMKNQGRNYQPRLQYSSKERPNSNFFELPGKVLHLDGDDEFRSTCQQHYLQMKVPCRVIHVKEAMQADVVVSYLQEDRPDILVLTGHDGLLKGTHDYYNMSNYRHSQYFVDAIRKAREYEPDLDDLVIVAGACNSYFEALIEAGANFASAPKRVKIEALDPLLIAQNIAFTSIYDKIALPQFLAKTKTGPVGIGGVQTRGKLRLGHPRA